MFIVELRRHILNLEYARRLPCIRLELLTETVLLLLKDAVRDAGGGNLLVIHGKIFVVQVFLDLFTKGLHTVLRFVGILEILT